MSNPQLPRPLNPQQLLRLRAFIYIEPQINHQEFSAKWYVSRELIAQICRVDIRTCNSWFSQGRTHQEPQPYHKLYLSLADLILESFDELPEFLQTLLCPPNYGDF
jgi:hypothetical protein